MARAAQATMRVSRRMASAFVSVKVGKLTEESEALIDLLSRERLHLFRTEALHRKGAHDTAIEHGVLEGLESYLGLRGKIAEEAAGEGISCSGGIDYFFQRQSRWAERQTDFGWTRSVEALIAKECRGAIFPVLHDERLW